MRPILTESYCLQEATCGSRANDAALGCWQLNKISLSISNMQLPRNNQHAHPRPCQVHTKMKQDQSQAQIQSQAYVLTRGRALAHLKEQAKAQELLVAKGWALVRILKWALWPQKLASCSHLTQLCCRGP